MWKDLERVGNRRDAIRKTWQDFARFGNVWEYPTRPGIIGEDLARRGKFRQALTRCGQIWEYMAKYTATSPPPRNSEVRISDHSEIMGFRNSGTQGDSERPYNIWQGLARFGKSRKDLTVFDMTWQYLAIFGKIRHVLTGFGKIYNIG